VARPPYDPTGILRMLLVAYLYDLSEPQVEEMVNYHLPMKYFVGLAVNERAPDHSTLTASKGRLQRNGHVAVFQEMLQQVIAVAGEQGIQSISASYTAFGRFTPLPLDIVEHPCYNV
jgi:transposase